jgi:hypothetical protein
MASTFSLVSQTTHNLNVTVAQNPCLVANIHKNDLQKYLKVYPNPFKEILKVEMTTEILNEEISLTIINILGDIIFQKQNITLNKDKALELNLSELNAGFYMIIIQNRNMVLNQKLIKN